MKKISSYFRILAFLILAMVTFSCEIGLGAAIDIVPPKAEISSPKDSAIIRGDFSLFGTWTDDGELGKVEVVLQSTSNSSLHYNFKGEFTGNLPNEEKTWKCLINPVSSTPPVKDGEYTATISFFDKAGRESKVTKTFTIDNTPPVIVLQRPGTKIGSANADSYGQTFSLEGQGADSNNIDHIDIRIYDDSACLNHLRTVTLNNVPLNIKLDVATFGKDVYTAIYGSTKNGEKKLYCEIDSYDGAQKYPTEIGKKQTAEDLIGNKTSTYYLYDDLQNILSKYNIARLYEMMNGTYSPSEDGSSSGESAEQIIEKVKQVLSGRESMAGMFSLNPENNPRFTVNGKDALRAENLNMQNQNQGYYITEGTEISVEVSPGLDGTPLVNTTESPLKVYAIECNAQGTVLPGAKEIYLHVVKNFQKAGSTYKLFVKLDLGNSVSEDGTEHLQLGKTYRFGVKGKDDKGNGIIASASTGYGFLLESSGLAPELKVTTPVDSTVYVKKGDGVTIIGETTTGAGLPLVEIFIGSSTIPAYSHQFTDSEGTPSGGNKKYIFNTVIPSNEFSQTDDKDYSIDIKSSIGGKASTITKTVFYDVHEPTIDFTNITPVITSYEFESDADKALASDNINLDGTFKNPFINGKVHFKGIVQDTFTKIASVDWHVNQDNVTIPGLFGHGLGASFDVELDTTLPGVTITDNKELTVVFEATDSAGNKKTVNNKYFVCQNTDKPVAGPNNQNAWTSKAQQPKQIKEGSLVSPSNPASRMNKLFAGSSIYAKVTDDDGIRKVEFKVEKLGYDTNYENSYVLSDQTSVPTEVKSETITDLGDTVETIVSHQMPSSSGYFKVTITVTDLNNVSCVKSFVVQMTGAAPDVTVTNKSDFIKNGDKVKLEVKMTGEAPFTIVVLQDDGTPNWQQTNSETESGDTKEIEVTPIPSHVSQKIKVKVTDSSGGSTTKEVSYKVDNTGPTVPVIESPAAGSTGNNSLSGSSFVFTGTANDAPASNPNETTSGIKKLYYKFMTSDTSPTTWDSQVAVSGTWNINATLQNGHGTSSGTTLYEGTYWLYVKSEDGAGNESAVVKREFSVDQAAPSVTEVKLNGTQALTEGGVKYFNSTSGNFTISGKVTDTNGLQSFKVNGASVTLAPDGTWSYDITRAIDSQIDFSIVATDKAGRTTTKNYSIYCDTKPPTLSITNPDADLTGETSLAADSYTFRASVNDSGSGVDSFKYMITQDETSAESGTGWTIVTGSSFSVQKELIEGTTPQLGKLHEGKWYLYTYAKDKIGTAATEKRTFWVDKKSPTLSLDNIASVTNQAVVVKGSATDANGIKDVKVKFTPRPLSWSSDTKTLTETEFATGQTYTAGSGNDLPDGNYSIQITATDKAGKTVTQTRTVLVDTAIPDGTVSIDSSETATVIGSENWYKKGSLKVRFTQTPDSGSEIEEVKAKFIEDGGSDYSGLQDFTKKTQAGNTWWEGTLNAARQGKNCIYLVVKDNAGNERIKNTNDNIAIYIDTESPDDCTVYNYVLDSTNYSTETAITGSKTINGKIPRTFVIKAVDNDDNGSGTFSGIGKIYYKYDNVDAHKIDATVLNASDNTYKITIPANTISDIYQKTGTVKFYLEDKVGNRMEFSSFSFVLDTTPPAVVINPVTDSYKASDGDATSNIDVNGEVVISGTSNEIATVTLKYFVGTAEPNWATDSGVKTATVNGAINWTSSISTITENDTSNLYVKAFAKDEAGNEGESITTILYINQDSDRPIITFSNLDLSATTVWLKGIKTVYGSVLDDDGTINSIEYKNGAGGTYHSITIDNSSWEQEMADGQNDIYFKITDAKGTVFETGTTKQPKLKSVKSGSTTIKEGVLTIKVDTTPPRYTNLEFASKKTDGTTSPHTTTITDLTFGGDYAKLLVKLKASDENGVASVKLKLGNQTYDATIEGANSAEQDTNKNNSDSHSWEFGEITIPNNLTGPTVMRLIITDQAGTNLEDNINFEIDNTKPVLSFTSHNDGAIVFATANVTVRGGVDSNDLEEWKYALTNTNAQPAVGDARYKPLVNASTSFTLVFDGASSTTTETHAQTLFSQICTLEGINETQLQADDTIRDLYLHIYGKDRAGNQSAIKTLHIKAIPNGDKPTVSFSYPATNGASLGGTIRVTGASEIQQSEVDAVYIQIDPKPTLAWETSENGTYTYDGSVYTKYTGKRYKYESGSYIEDLNGDHIKIGSAYVLAANNLYRVKDATFTNSWDTNFSDAGGTNARYQRTNVTYSGGNETAIKTGGSVSSWNIALNAYNELNASKAVALRIFSVSKTGKKSDYQTVWFRMDPDAPQIGSTIPLELVQYAGGASSGTIVARRSYESDMWIKGQWYLCGSVTDDSGIKSIRLKIGNESPVDIVTITDPLNNIGTITTHSIYKNYVKLGAAHGLNNDYELNIPVGSTESDKFGTLTYEISATEGASQSLGTKQTIKVNFDNKAPEFAGTTSEVLNKASWAEKLTTQLTGNEVIQNSGGNYRFYGIVNEASDATGNQSGFNRVAMYFTRTRPDGNTYVIDPMRKGGASGLDNFIEISSEFEPYKSVATDGDGLYWLKARQFTVSGNNILTPTTTSALHESIRRGGLVKINGAMYVINTVDTTNRQITIKGSIADGSVDAYFAVCQVIDNFTQENGTTKAYDPAHSLEPSSNDDGDQMIESVIENGTISTLKAFIDSKLILDGDVKIHFVAFDKAGNATEKEYSAIVRNNAPRLFGVKYGTDVNGNGTIEDGEYVKTFNDKYSAVVSGTTYYGYSGSTDNPIYSITATESLTVKATLKVVPRVVGGNLGLGYTYTYKPDPAVPATTTTSFKAYSGAGHHDPESLALRPDNLAIEITQKDFIQYIQDGDQNITFKLWDKTDGTTAGTDSNAATIVIPVKVAVRDVEAPKAGLKPFKWLSENENSLYANSKKNGHIELEADLPSSTFTSGGSGVYDKDPKISGIVTFEGSVTDNVIVNEILIKIPNYNGGNAFAIATRGSDGKMNSANLLTLSNVAPIKTYDDYNFAGTDWYFEVLTDKFENDGSNTVKFKFHFNTQKITGVAQTDVEIELSAKDRGKASVSGTSVIYTPNASTPGTTQTTVATNTGYYKVDVVPYITGVSRNSMYNTNRARSGATPLLREEKGNTITGFNFADGSGTSLKITENKDGSGSSVAMEDLTLSSDKKSFTFKVPDTAKDGYLHLVVNGVTAVNNMNGYTESNMEEADTYGTSKHSDDRLVHIWRVNKEDTFKGSKNAVYPAMRKGPNDTLYASFSNYSTSRVYYSNEFTGDPAHSPEIGGTGTTILFTGYDPPEETDITINGNEVNVLYAANYHGGSAYQWGDGSTHNGKKFPWNDTDHANAGGIYLYDKDGYSEGRHTKLYRFELYTYDNELQQFKNIRTVRSGDNIYVVYYDRLTAAVKFGWVDDSTKPDTRVHALPWCVIDGTFDKTDKECKVPDHLVNTAAPPDPPDNIFEFASPNGTSYKTPYILDNPNNFEDGLSVSNGVWESVAVTVTKDGYPVVVYMDAATGRLRLARSTSKQPTAPADWKIQSVLAISGPNADPNGKLASDYINAGIGSDGYLHIAFQNTRGQLVYVKSTNKSDDGSAQYTFGKSEVLDDSGMFIDMTMDDATPYITYMSRPNSYDAIRIAYKASMDFNNTGTDVPGWETMTAPLNQRAANGRICVATKAKHFGATTDTMPIAIGFNTGSDYRAAFFVGK